MLQAIMRPKPKPAGRPAQSVAGDESPLLASSRRQPRSPRWSANSQHDESRDSSDTESIDLADNRSARVQSLRLAGLPQQHAERHVHIKRRSSRSLESTGSADGSVLSSGSTGNDDAQSASRQTKSVDTAAAEPEPLHQHDARTTPAIDLLMSARRVAFFGGLGFVGRAGMFCFFPQTSAQGPAHRTNKKSPKLSFDAKVESIVALRRFVIRCVMCEKVLVSELVIPLIHVMCCPRVQVQTARSPEHCKLAGGRRRCH